MGRRLGSSCHLDPCGLFVFRWFNDLYDIHDMQIHLASLIQLRLRCAILVPPGATRQSFSSTAVSCIPGACLRRTQRDSATLWVKRQW